MKLVICTKFQINRMNCVESRREGGDPIASPPPPSRLRVTVFSSRLLGLNSKRLSNLNPFFYTSRCIQKGTKMPFFGGGYLSYIISPWTKPSEIGYDMHILCAMIVDHLLNQHKKIYMC